jgi:enoyl-CoA hydratase/carnithine racemase
VVGDNINDGEATGVVVTLDDDGVGRLTISRPERMNALDTAASTTIIDTLHRWAADDAVRVVVLDGAGGSFSTGADVTSMAQGGAIDGFSKDQARGIISNGSDLARAVRAVPVPVVAAVDGAAAGIGASLALSADLIYATARSYFLLAFINIGLMPDGGASMLVSAAVGRARANAMALLGEKLRAPAAFDAGLITDVVADREVLDETVGGVVAKLAAASPTALRLTKAALDAHTMAGFEEALGRELDGQTTLLQSPEFSAALAAFAAARH